MGRWEGGEEGREEGGEEEENGREGEHNFKGRVGKDGIFSGAFLLYLASVCVFMMNCSHSKLDSCFCWLAIHHFQRICVILEVITASQYHSASHNHKELSSWRSETHRLAALIILNIHVIWQGSCFTVSIYLYICANSNPTHLSVSSKMESSIGDEEQQFP